MKEFVLQQQCPSADVALKRAEASILDFERSVAQEADDTTCCCPHLLEYLPDELDLTFAKSETRGWMLQNPIHALHLASQLDPAWLQSLEDPPVLYGEEQERLYAITMEGIPETWHPWTTNGSEESFVKEQQTSDAEPASEDIPTPTPPSSDNIIQQSGSTPEPSAVASDSVAEIKPTVVTDLSDEKFEAMYAQEGYIHSVQENLLGRRRLSSASTMSPGVNKKRKEATSAPVAAVISENIKSSSTVNVTATGAGPSATTTPEGNSPEPRKHPKHPRFNITQRPWAHPIVHFTRADEIAWESKLKLAQDKVATWLQQYKNARKSFYADRLLGTHGTTKSSSFFQSDRADARQATCQTCHKYSGDELMQCLECSFVGCYVTEEGDDGDILSEHMMEHFVVKNHNFAVTCGPLAKIFCFKCGAFVTHPVFTQEKERFDLIQELPWMGWKEHPLQRSFDALRFMRIPGQGIIWRGMFASYPPLVPREHVESGRLCRWRQCLFHGNVLGMPQTTSVPAKAFALIQCDKGKDPWKLPAPVGMYNLGNSCFMTAILQCLAHTAPVQRYFLCDVGHNHVSCKIYRDLFEKKLIKSTCLACETDKLFLAYFENTHGVKVQSLLDTRTDVSSGQPEPLGNSVDDKDDHIDKAKGEPLVTSDMLTVAWKSISHIAGYEQRDAHEFLHSFLDVLGKHMRLYRVRVHNTINMAQPNNSFLPHFDATKQDAMKSLFEGTLRSVLVCQKCSNKRIQSEPFMSISLPLSKEICKASDGLSITPDYEPISIERCLKHFTMPEVLADPVDCPTCREKTPTTRQHVVSRLPKVLVLHLKRFDFVENRKIEEFVSFPAHDLNMGPYLPHWCEIPRAPPSDALPTPPTSVEESIAPRVLYNLQSTVNHYGTLQSGHYYANIKVDQTWYHCNDSHVSCAPESEVIAQPAYMLFYTLETLNVQVQSSHAAPN